MLRHDPLANPEPLIRRVYAYVAYRVGDGPDAEDLTSETFERALRYRKSFDPRKGEPAAWLIGIAKRCIDGRGPRLELVAEHVDSQDPCDVELEAIRRLTVARAVETLDQRDRELIALRYGADLSARQIAELLDVRTNTVEVALHRALARLRGAFVEDEPEPVRKRAALG
jgi:RNA polymerase sigma factor (sigma-70 family)